MTVMLLAQIFCLCFSIYFYLIHEDLDKGLIDPMDLTSQLSDYQPWEMYMQIFLTFLCLFSGHWGWFLIMLPLAALHFKILVKQEHKLYCFTIKEYKQGDKKSQNEKFFLYKSIFYGVSLGSMIAIGLYSAVGLISNWGKVLAIPGHPYLSKY